MADTMVESEIPGKVLRIEAPVGTQVEEDDPILFVESMKMEIPIGAPKAGTARRRISRAEVRGPVASSGGDAAGSMTGPRIVCAAHRPHDARDPRPLRTRGLSSDVGQCP